MARFALIKDFIRGDNEASRHVEVLEHGSFDQCYLHLCVVVDQIKNAQSTLNRMAPTVLEQYVEGKMARSRVVVDYGSVDEVGITLAVVEI